MNNVLIKKATIVDSNSPYNGKKLDILIEKGKIVKIGKDIDSKHKTLEINNLHVSPGWLDMHANFRDPGFEHQEDITTGIKAAAKGGYTGVCVMPNTSPCIDNKPGVEYIINRSKGQAVDVYPIGCVSEKHEGKNISEMYDMYKAGAVAFCDDKKSIQNADLLKRALLYTKQFDGLTMQFANDQNIAQGGQMNEGITSTLLGLKGIPALAEEIMIARDLFLLEYTDSKLHFTTISTARSAELIKKAKNNDQNVTCDVAAYNLFFDDESLEEFDSNLKTLPPIRDKKEIKGLIKALKDGTIDVIVSDHQPKDIELKKLEFDLASFGMIGLQTTFAAANTALTEHLTINEIIDKFTTNPRKILNLKEVSIKEESTANLTFFDPELTWTFTNEDIVSKSKNTPFVNTTFIGKPLGIYNNGELVL